MGFIVIEKIDNIHDALNCYHRIVSLDDSEIIVDLSIAHFVRSSFVCILGLAIKNRESCGKIVKIIEPNEQKMKKILGGIGFLDGYPHGKKVILYRNISLSEEVEFYSHFDTYFVQKAKMHLTNVSNALFQKLMQKVLELFSNAFRHSKSQNGIFCSGQFFPKEKKFSFVIADNGIGIKNNVESYLQQQSPKKWWCFRRKIYVPADKAILWAINKGNSTTGKGGLGLDLLKEFVLENKGRLEIVSSNGLYCIDGGMIQSSILEREFDGTIIAVSLRVDDRFYKLRSEQC